MNTTYNDTPNYPFLSGWLESEMKGLCYDGKFVKMGMAERLDYVRSIITEPRKEAIKYQNSIGN